MLGIVSIGIQKGQLRVIHDVIVSAVESMFGSADEQVSIMLPTFPPDWEVEAGPTELEALMQLRTPEHLLANFP
jgi:hypothetical protein